MGCESSSMSVKNRDCLEQPRVQEKQYRLQDASVSDISGVSPWAEYFTQTVPERSGTPLSPKSSGSASGSDDGRVGPTQPLSEAESRVGSEIIKRSATLLEAEISQGDSRVAFDLQSALLLPAQTNTKLTLWPGKPLLAKLRAVVPSDMRDMPLVLVLECWNSSSAQPLDVVETPLGPIQGSAEPRTFHVELPGFKPTALVFPCFLTLRIKRGVASLSLAVIPARGPISITRLLLTRTEAPPLEYALEWDSARPEQRPADLGALQDITLRLNSTNRLTLHYRANVPMTELHVRRDRFLFKLAMQQDSLVVPVPPPPPLASPPAAAAVPASGAEGPSAAGPAGAAAPGGGPAAGTAVLELPEVYFDSLTMHLGTWHDVITLAVPDGGRLTEIGAFSYKYTVAVQYPPSPSKAGGV